jgi:hypothetical protein
LILNVPGVAAFIDFSTLVAQTRQLSMSGVLGILETDILFAEAGTSQPELWRIAQGTLGIGALRVLSKITLTPCFEVLHMMFGIKPPEAVQAREFWLRQEAWTEVSILDMGQEDTSYHRINQGCGPQGKLLWNWEEIEIEREWWGKIESNKDLGSTPTPKAANSDASGLGNASPETLSLKKQSELAWGDVKTSVEVAGKKKKEVSEGTTDKWWMDRWQIEALAVASALDLTLEEACNLLTTAYFGRSTGRIQQLLGGISCVFLTTLTFLTAWYTNWSWVSQFLALSCLGYFVNWTASLRGWKFEPTPTVGNFKPKIDKSWPADQKTLNGGGAIRIAVQSSGAAHLRGIIIVPEDILDKAKQIAQAKLGRYSLARKRNKLKVPYTNAQGVEENHWISFESQASFYGLLVSISPENVDRRSIGVLWTMLNGVLLLVLGFGASTPKNWSGYILLIYLAGIVFAILGRRQEAEWTLPEFAKVDFTAKPMEVPLTMRDRLMGMRGAESLTNLEVRNRNVVSYRPWLIGWQDKQPGIFSFLKRTKDLTGEGKENITNV